MSGVKAHIAGAGQGGDVADGGDAGAASGEETAMGDVDGHGDGVLAGGGRPAAENLSRFCIDFDDLALAGDVDVELSLSG
jgi:hypothetical protein